MPVIKTDQVVAGAHTSIENASRRSISSVIVTGFVLLDAITKQQHTQTAAKLVSLAIPRI